MSIRSPPPIKRRSISPSPSLRYSTNHRQSATSSSSSSSNRTSDRNKSWSYGSKKTCLCSPTNHPGSFRCSLHKNSRNSNGNGNSNTTSYQTYRLFARKSAMTNSLVRSGKVEGDLVKRALAALIRPSSHQLRRRTDFRPRLSRLSVMSKADN